MALAVTLLGSANWATTNSSDFTVTATPAVGDLIVLVGGFTGNVNTPTFSDNAGGTYTVIKSALFNTSASVFAIAVRNSLITSATSTVFTCARSGTTSGGGVSVLKITGSFRAGNSAVRSSGSQANVASGTPAPVLNLTPLTGNAIITGVFNAATAVPTIPTNYVSRNSSTYTSPTSGEITASKDSGVTNATITWGGAAGGPFASVAIELDSTAAPVLPPYAHSLGIDHLSPAFPRSHPVKTRRS